MTDARARLRRDWAAWQGTSVGCPGISCAPLDDDLLEWHANLEGGHHYAGMTLHVVLRFPESYPRDPPRVSLCTYIPHSNIIPSARDGGTLCLNMLNSVVQSRTHEGWSSAYSVASILLQLQIFLFDEWVSQEDFGCGTRKNTLWDRVLEEGSGRRSRGEVDRKLAEARASAGAFRCRCGHAGTAPWPAIAHALPPATWRCSLAACHLCWPEGAREARSASTPESTRASTGRATPRAAQRVEFVASTVVRVAGAWAELASGDWVRCALPVAWR